MPNTSTETVLFVDDDQHLLDSIRRQYRKSFDLQIAVGGEEGLRMLREHGPFAVVVSDYQMPGMNGITFLKGVREQSPDSVRIMMTGNADLQSAINAVNDGHVFRYLTKPCSAEALTEGIRAALDQYRLRLAERYLLEETLRGSIEVMVDVLALANPFAFGRSTRVRGYVRQMAIHMGLENIWQYETAALLSQIGCVAIPSALIERVAAGLELTPEQSVMFERHTEVARDLLSKIPRLEVVAEIIARQNQKDVSKEINDDIRRGAQILAAALAFDEFISLGAARQQALDAVQKGKGSWDTTVLEALATVTLPGQGKVAKMLTIAKLRVGMIVDANVMNKGGMVLVGKGHQISQGTLVRLINHAQLGGVVEPIRVLVPELLDGTKTAA